jgi:tetratricopeptide (TPR) repeat protein
VPHPEDPDAERAGKLKRSGDEAFVKSDFAAAQELYTGALRHDTSDHALWANRSAASLRLGRFEEALLDARRARTLNPQYAKVEAAPRLVLIWKQGDFGLCGQAQSMARTRDLTLDNLVCWQWGESLASLEGPDIGCYCKLRKRWRIEPLLIQSPV